MVLMLLAEQFLDEITNAKKGEEKTSDYRESVEYAE